MSKEITLPDYLQDMVEDTSSQNLVAVTDSVPRISLKGKKFRLIEGGEEVERFLESMHIIILGTVPEKGMAKTFYLGDYNPDDSGPPDCSSTNGIKPDPWVNSPQNDVCMGCKNNAWGSAKSMSGKKAKACRDSKRLMVVKAGDMLGTIYILNVTVASLKNLSTYGRYLVENRVPMAAVITTLVMVDESDFPMLDFQYKGVLKETKGVICLERAAKKEWDTFDMNALGHGETGSGMKQLDQKQPEKTKAVKGELVDDDDELEKPKKEVDDVKAHVSDVDDLLEGWDE